MKKLLFPLCLMLVVSTSLFAQRSNVNRANNLILQEKPDFKGARETIKPAFEDEKTKSEANTYYVAGMIGYTENDYLNKLLMLGKEKEVNQDVKGQAIMESIDYFKKANELDQMPNAKGKVRPKFSRRIKDNLKEYYNAQHNLFAYAIHLFNTENYTEAANVFATLVEIPKMPVLNNEIPTNDSTYLQFKYLHARAITNTQNHKKAIELYEDLKKDNYETRVVYSLLAEAYHAINDSVKYLATLEEGFSKCSDEPWFLQNIINIYLRAGRIDDAAKYLEEAIALQPNVPDYYYVKGNIQERLGNLDVAIAAFDRAIELKPDMALAYDGKGRVIFNQGVEIINLASDIKDNNAYNAEIEKAFELFKQSAPIFEKAVEIDPSNHDIKQTLKMVYYRLKDIDDYGAKYDALVKELGD
ncbi:MAG TPA: tetratricopeptide repeat protein [Bacteroidales bacterium]|nr:tetratricopeptide repeat protein [Bacteroidales bacterium]